MNTVRWLSIAPCAVLAWYATLFAGLAMLFGIQALCPYNDSTSGSCGASWYAYAEWLVMKASVAASAFVVVMTAAVVAPTHRLPVAWLAYVAGAAVATYFVTQTSALGEYIAALLAGLLAVYVVATKVGRLSRPSRSHGE